MSANPKLEVGIMARTFPRATLSATLDSVLAHGVRCIQFNFASAGLASLPELIPDDRLGEIAAALRSRSIRVAAVSGTFNLVHPDPAVRRGGLLGLREVARAAASLGTEVITLCTGTCDPVDMWRAHPGNNLPEVWRLLRESVAEALVVTEPHGVRLAFEPELNNVVFSARRARQLLEDINSPRLGIVMDPANLLPAGTLARQTEVLNEAFELLGPSIVLAHAKDLVADGDVGRQAAGTGLLDYDLYLRLLVASGYSGALILHSLTEAQVPAAIRFLSRKLDPLHTSAGPDASSRSP